MSELPPGWELTTLGTIRVDRSRSIDPRRTPEEEFDLFSVPSLAAGVPEQVKGSEVGSTKKTLCAGTVVISKINPRLNRVWVIPESRGCQQIGSGEWIVFSPTPAVAPKFIGHFLSSGSVRDYLAANVSGVGGSLMRVRPATLDRYTLPLPPLPEQQRIVEAIEEQFSRLDAGVASLQRAKRNLARLRASVLSAAVEGRLVEQSPADEPAAAVIGANWANRRRAGTRGQRTRRAPHIFEGGPWSVPGGWCWVSLETVAAGQPNSLKAGPFGSSLKKEQYVSTGYKIYGQEQVIRGDPNHGDYYIDEPLFESLRSNQVQAGDLLVSLVGTIGKTLVLPATIEPGIINPRLVKITLDPELMSPHYLSLVLRSPGVRRSLGAEAHGQTMDVLNLTILKAAPIPCPPRPEQDRILAEVDRQFSILDSISATVEAGLARAQRLRQSILREAFAGRLVPQDPEDEPASALFARIQSERSKQ